MREPTLFYRLMERFLILARDALDDDATRDEIIFEARVLYGQFFGWTPARTTTLQ